MADYGEIFCTAVNEIVKQQIGQINFDLTKDCTVVSVQNKKDSEYLVSDGSSTFKAYAAAGASYALGDQVLVSIPEGDYNKQKTIINKVVSNESSPIGYVSPLDDFIAGSGNVIQVAEVNSIAANGNEILKHLFTLNDSENIYFGFTKIALTADFMTLLDNLGLVTGEYGLKLIVKDASGKVADLSFSSSEMLGNPYMFNTYLHQEYVFTMPDSFTNINSIDLYLYQDGRFTDGRNPLTYDGEIIDNIFVKNINVVLGFSSGHATSELVQLSVDNVSYASNDNVRYPVLQWFHLVDTGVFEPINMSNWVSGDKPKNQYCEIRWYQYEPGCAETDTDEYGDTNWKWLNQPECLAGVPANYPFSFPITLSERKETEKIKVVTIYTEYPLHNDPTYKKVTNYTSNILEFKNITEETSGGTQTDEQVTEDLSLFFTDNSYGNYFWYDQNGILIDPANQGSSKQRTVEIRAKGASLDSNWESYKAIDWIRWEVPAIDDLTMIIPNSSMGFSNPNDAILTALDAEVEHTNTGNFNFTAKVEFNNEDDAKAVDQIKVILSTWVNDSWDAPGNRPILNVISTDGATSKEINTTFKINRAHSKLKITFEYYKDNVRVDDTNVKSVNDISLKQQTSFWVATKTKEDGASMSYAIKNNWTQNRDNNMIKCTVSVNGVPHVLTETLRFGPKGSSGTANTFLLEILDGKNALEIGEGKELQIQAILIGGNGKRIMFPEGEASQIKWSLLNSNNDHMELSGEGDVITLTSKTNSLPNNNYAILQAKYTYPVEDAESKKAPELYAFLPIPMKTSSCTGMQGATQIIYNHQGVPKYSNTAYIAFGEAEERDWQLQQDSMNPNPVQLVDTLDVIQSKALLASPLYSTKQDSEAIIQDKICVSCDGYWSQPILIMQSQYDFAMLNSWDGSLTIDEENGIILATMIGAGKKDRNNKFSGVLMGDLKGGTDLNDTESMTGVYGFDDGIMSYALREDGTGFFGAKKNGRIEFNGEHGAIHSYGWKPKYETGTDENNNSISWTKWTLDEASKGSVFDLDDGQLQLYAGENNYFKYNDNNSGKLEMALSGADIKLNDKDNNPGLSGYIDATAQGLVTEFRRTAAYYATCDTGSSWTKTETDDSISWSENEDNKTKELVLKNFSEGYNTDEKTTDESVKIDNLTTNDIFKDGITIAVTFTEAQLVKEIITQNTDDSNSRNENDPHTGSSITYTGHKLQLSIDGNCKVIYINNADTSNTNHFGWSAGATVYFTYVGDKNSGHWEVTDSGSYSNIIQTADTIYSEVSQIGGSLSSSIQQTAASIESEVRRYAGYVGTCDTTNNTNTKIVILKNAPEKNFKMGNLLQEGVGLAVKFTEKQDVFNTKEGKIKLQIQLPDTDKDDEGENSTSAIKISLEDGGKFSWTEYSTIYFIYTGGAWQVTDAGNYSRITQTANAIVAEVQRKAQYYGTCSTEDNTITKTVILKNPLKADPENNGTANIEADDLYQTGVTIAVTFTNQQTTTTTKQETKQDSIIDGISYEYNDITYTITGAELSLTIKTDTDTTLATHPIYIQNNKTDLDNHFGWEAGSTIYFTFNNEIGGWLVSDSGSYSKITQTADMIKAQIGTLDNKYSSAITQTAKQIRLEVNQKANYTATCETEADTATKILKINNNDATKLKALLEDSNITVDCIILVKFTKANTVTEELEFEIYNTNYSFSVNNNPQWEAGETIPFRLYRPANDTGTFTMTSLSNSAITQAANAITSEVHRVGGYACSATLIKDTSNDWELTINAKNEQGIPYSYNELKSNDKVIAVTFASSGSNKSTVWLKFPGDTANTTGWHPVFFNGTVTSNTNPLNWSKGAVLYFYYDSEESHTYNNKRYDGVWVVVDSGAYSKIQQTADTLVAKVGGSDTAFSWDLNKNYFSLNSYLNNQKTEVFRCDKDGVVVKGEIHATSLTLGDGVKISANDISDLPAAPDLTNYIQVNGTIGSTPSENATGFQVSSAGLLKASNAIIYGTVYASKGTIGGWTLSGNSLSTGTFGSENGILFTTQTTAEKSIGGTTTNNWRLTIGNNFGVTGKGNLYCSGLYASGGTIYGNVTIKGKLDGATGSFSGSVTAGNLLMSSSGIYRLDTNGVVLSVPRGAGPYLVDTNLGQSCTIDSKKFWWQSVTINSKTYKFLCCSAPS